MPKNMCGKYIIPGQLIEIDTHYYEWKCNNNGIPNICRLELNKTFSQESCFSGKKCICTVKMEKCDPYNFHNDDWGVLVTTRLDVHILLSGDKKAVTRHSFNNHSKFISWNGTTAVILGKVYLEQPNITLSADIIDVPVNYTIEMNETLFSPHIDTSSTNLLNMIHRQNKTINKINFKFKDISPFALKPWFHGTVAVGFIITAIILFVIICCVCRSTSTCKCFHLDCSTAV